MAKTRKLSPIKTVSSLITIMFLAAGIALLSQAQPNTNTDTRSKASGNQKPIIVYDITDYKNRSQNINYYEQLHALVAIQGIVNRNQPNLFLSYFENKSGQAGNLNAGNIQNYDVFWLKKLCGNNNNTCQSNYSQIDGRQIIRVNSSNTNVPTLAKNYFKDYIKGFVIWDDQVPATSNAAITIAGVRDSVPLRNSSNLRTQFQNTFPQTPIVENLHQLNFRSPNIIPELNNSEARGSSKANVYRWLMEKYGIPGRFPNIPKYSWDYAGQYLDAMAATFPGKHFYTNNLSHLDWMVKNKGLVFDLSPHKDKPICDSPGAKNDTDNKMIHALLWNSNQNDKGAKYFHGHPGWTVKYSSWRNCENRQDPSMHPSWVAEHEMVNIFSRYNFINIKTDAESGCCDNIIGPMPNSSFYSHLGPKDRKIKRAFGKPRIPKITFSPNNKTQYYVLFVNADYDSPAWTYYMLQNKAIWEDPNRGQIPITWGINTAVLDTQPFLANYILKTKTANDFFAAGSGFGYFDIDSATNKNAIRKANLQSMRRNGISHLTTYFITQDVRGTYDISKSGLNHLKRIARLGIGKDLEPKSENNLPFLVNQTPVVTMPTFIHSTESLQTMVNKITTSSPARTTYKDKPNLLLIRAVTVSPTTLVNLMTELNKNNSSHTYQAIDHINFFNLARQYAD